MYVGVSSVGVCWRKRDLTDLQRVLSNSEKIVTADQEDWLVLFVDDKYETLYIRNVTFNADTYYLSNYMCTPELLFGYSDHFF